jgi:tetratricopeptide (TPR) repeat protein
MESIAFPSRWRVAATLLAIGIAPFAESARAQNRPVTYTADVAPLIQKYCAQCHHPGGPGPFALTTYPDARSHARQIAAVIQSRYMPPWQTEPGFGEFIGQSRPTDEESRVFRQWAEGGAPEGVHRAAPKQTWPSDAWRLGQPDLVVTPAEAFELPAGGTDVFRIFVIPVPIGTPRYVRGLEFLPGNARVVHHANLRIDRTPRSRELDAKDPAPGYDGLLARSALFPDGHFLGWTPGQAAPLLPKGLAWRLEPGSDLVVQVHMRPGGKVEPVRPSIGFFFGVDPPDRTPAMLRLGRQNIDIAAGEAYTVEDSYTLPVDVEVQAVQPHAHYRAREVRGVATLPDGTTKWLIDIKNWNFRWQHLYRYEKPFTLPKGTVLSMRYTYDNSADNPQNPVSPPARALWGQRSAEEMGDLWIQVLTRNDADLATLNRDFRPKAVREDLIGYESLIVRDPSDAGLHDDAAVLYLELGEIERAALHFAATARLTPGVASAHFNVGTVTALTGKLEAAAAEFEAAIALNPEYDKAHYSLGIIRRQLGDPSGAISSLRKAVALNAQWLAPTVDLAWILATSRASDVRSRDEAVMLATRAVALTDRPDPAVLDTLAVAYAAAGQFDAAISAAQAALAAGPPNDLAEEIRARLALYRAGKSYLR